MRLGVIWDGLGWFGRVVAAALLALAASGAALAQTPAADSLFYYEIGGASSLSPPAAYGVERARVGFSARLTAGNACGGFDPSISITNLMNDISSAVDNMGAAVQGAIGAAIANLPWLILQRANPGLYDLLQNALLRFEEQIELATKSCEQMMADVAAGKNPFAEFVSLSVGEDWKVALGNGGIDMVDTRRTIDRNAGNNGIRWVGGRRGGVNQEPIRVVEDTVRAGYNVTLDRAPSATGAPSNTAAISQLWPTPQAASQWAVDAFGDLEVTTCQEGTSGCPETTGQPGSGLVAQQDDEWGKVVFDFADVLYLGDEPNPEALDKVSAPGVEVAWPLLQALQAMPEEQRSVAFMRLVGEISTARTVEKALYVRRLILAGRQTPDVAAAEPAQKLLDRKLVEIDREIDNLLFENRVRRELVSATAAAVLQAAGGRQTASDRSGPGTVEVSQPVTDGGTTTSSSDGGAGGTGGGQ